MDIITGTQIYWLTRCDAIKQALHSDGGFLALAIISLVAAVFVSIGVFSEKEDYAKYSRYVKDGKDYESERDAASFNFRLLSRMRTALAVVFALFTTLWVLCRLVHPLVPTTKEMAAIIVIPRVANAESVQDVGREIVDLAKDWMQELRPANVKEAVQSVKTAVDGTLDKLNGAREESK